MFVNHVNCVCCVCLWQLERSNYQLQVFEETARNKEPADGRLVQHLLRSPSSEDGGQWDMLVGLIEKYGIMPQACFPDTWNCQNSRKVGKLMDSKVCQLSETKLNSSRLSFERMRVREPRAAPVGSK